MVVAASSRVWLVVFALFLGATLAAPMAAFPADERQAAAGPEPAALPLPDEKAITAALGKAHAAEMAARERQERELASPAAVRAREESRRVYADLTPAQAQELAASTFGEVLEELNRDPARYLSDARLERPAGKDAATVTSEGETQLLEASVPVRAEDEDGDLSKVDLTLVPTEDGWEPENPIVDVAVGDSAEEGVELSEAEVTISQAGAAAGAGRRLGDKNLFFGEVDTDTDLLVSPISTGVELFSVLRSEESPESLRFDLEIPEDAELRAGAGGSAEILDEEGKASVVIPAPWARDAQGTDVPVEMRVEGDSLMLDVAHRGQDLAYPILVDPTMYQNWGWWYQGQNLTGLAAFRWQTSGNAWWVTEKPKTEGFPGYAGKGLFIETAVGQLTGHQWGQWIYSAPNGGTYLANATINPFWRNNEHCSAPSPYYYPYDYAGMWVESTGWNRLLFNNANEQGWSTLESWGEALIVGMSTDPQTNTYMHCRRHLMLGGVGVWLDDWQYPTVTVLSFPSGWLKKDTTNRVVELRGNDGGLGVQRVRMYTGAKEWIWDQPWCAGTYENRCDIERTGKVNFTTESVGAEGKVNLGIQAIDPTDKRWALERTVMIDGTTPTLNLKGEPSSASYKLNIEAKDGSSTEPRSGVKEVKVYLDGQLKQTKTSSCSTSGCPATVSFTYSQSHAGLSLGQHTVEVVATDQVGYAKSAQTTFTVEEPDTMILSGPSGLTNQSSPTFTYLSSHSGSTFQCSIDGAPFVSCPSNGYTTPKLLDGPHTFSVRAVNAAGFIDPTPATRSFTVDATPPETTIEYGPSGPTNDATPAFGYSSDDPEASFECKLDSAPYAPCGVDEFEPETPLAEGAHTFSVRAVDRIGNLDASPATRSFTVDATPPTLQIESGPEGPTNQAKPTFTFSSSGASSLACAIDAEDSEGEAPDYGPCTTATSHSPLTPLQDGTYVFRVRAGDEAGNDVVDAREFTVDTAAPQTTIDSGPSGTTDAVKPTFIFSSSEPDSTFECRFDAEPFAPCSGPGASHTPAAALADGAHSFAVRAIDPAGNADQTPAVQLFTVSTGGPETTITAGPEGAIAQSSATFKYTADEPASFQCRMDEGLFLPCPAEEQTVSALTEGEHVFEVRALNNGLVVDPTPARRAFVVDLTPPSPPQASGPVREPNVPGLTLRLEAEDGDPSGSSTTRSGVKSFLVYVDGQLTETLEARCKQSLCPAEMVRTVQLPHPQVIGSHHYEVKARDGVGHTSPAVSWNEDTPKEGTLLDREPSPSVFAVAAASSDSCDGGLHKIKAERGDPLVRGTNRDDLIISAPGVIAIRGGNGCDVILGGPSQEVIKGGPGKDLIRGGRSDDKILGQGGEDQIYGGVGDDPIFGGALGDVLDGGPGADRVKGEEGNDTIRGGQGEDELLGGPGEDTLSYADALAPGFMEVEKQKKKAENQKINGQDIAGFPDRDESGVYINFNEQPARVFNGKAGYGGGTDKLPGGTKGNFERIIGSPFSDWIEGNAGVTQIDPGRGADLIVDVGGAKVSQSPGGDSVEGSPPSITPRGDSPTIQIGISEPTTGTDETSVYLVGGKADDSVAVKVSGKAVNFTARNKATKEHFEPLGKCNNVKNTWTVNCKLDARLGGLAVHGGKGVDRLSMAAETVKKPGSISIDGGPGADKIFGLKMEELLVDGGPQGGGREVLHGGGGDDALFQAEGEDKVAGDSGSDLIVSTRICGGDDLYGDKESGNDTGADNAQFAPLAESGVYVDLEDKQWGKVEKGSINKCGPLRGFNDAEGSGQRDILYGTNEANLLIGRGGKDSLFGRGKKDKLNGNDDEPDEKIDCGGQEGDVAIVDAIDVKTRAVRERDCDHVRPGRGKKQARAGLYAELQSEPPALGGLFEPDERPRSTGYYTFDDTSGTSAENNVEGDPGTYKAAGAGPSTNGPGPTLGVPGALAGEEEGTAVKLDGVDDYVDLGGQALPTAGEDAAYSLATFVKFARAPGQVEYLFSGVGSGEEGVFLYRAADGRLVFASGLEPGAPKVATPHPIADESWHQVVASLEGETITLNVDGFPYRLGYGSSVLPKLDSSPQALVGAGPGVKQLLAGSVDELGAYEGVFSESETFQQLGESEAEEQELLLAPPPETADADDDGVTDGADNCPTVANSDQADVDEDGIGDACEAPDGDGDGIVDADDNCPSEYNPDQADTNGDGQGDECAGMPPVADTDAAGDVKGSTATLNATIDAEGAATSYRFEYGTTTAYGSYAPFFPGLAGSGVDPVAVSQALSGLQPGTTYHYRIVAWSEFGEVEGEDQTFTTLKAPTVTTKPATNVGTTSAVLNGSVNPEGDASTYQFEYGKTTAYGSKVPLSPGSAGSGTSPEEVSEPVAGLEPDTTYHYRLVATNGAGAGKGSNGTFRTNALPVTGTQLAAMPVTHPFNGSTASLANFGSKWSALGWAAGTPAKGEETSSGWRPVPAFPTVNGAYYHPTLTDTGSGVAAVATLAFNPSNPERYFSLWLDMPTPGSTRGGYELRFTEAGSSSYTMALSKWVNGTRTVLASKSSYSLPPGSSFAILDQGSTVSAWTNTGSGFSQVLSATDSAYSGGNAGVEGAGNILRLSNFRVGVPLTAAANMSAALSALALNDSFAGSETPLSSGGSWQALQWAGSVSGYSTGRVANGWGPYDAFPTINGAYWQPASFADTGAGNAVAAKLTGNATITERHFSLWLDMPTPQSARSGYELRFTETASGVYSVVLSRWQAGAQTVLATKTGYPLPLQSRFALVSKAGVVSAWVATGTEFAQVLSAADSTFTSGYTGLEASGNIIRLSDFRSGPLPPF
jgi:Ca2+-binding RTX toxin-like protein